MSMTTASNGCPRVFASPIAAKADAASEAFTGSALQDSRQRVSTPIWVGLAATQSTRTDGLEGSRISGYESDRFNVRR